MVAHYLAAIFSVCYLWFFTAGWRPGRKPKFVAGLLMEISLAYILWLACFLSGWDLGPVYPIILILGLELFIFRYHGRWK